MLSAMTKKKKKENRFNHLKSRCFEMIEKKYSKHYKRFHLVRMIERGIISAH